MKARLITWAALLRGINVGGSNVIKMADLRGSFTRLGLGDVATLIASGNVVFRTALPRETLEQTIEAALSKQYAYESRIVLRTLEELASLVAAAPKRWGTDARRKYNVLFLRPAVDSADVLDGLSPKAGIEQVVWRPGALLWSALTREVTRTSMAKLSSKPLYQELTVRNWNTTQKLLALMKTVDAEARR